MIFHFLLILLVDPWFDMYINAREPLPLNFSAALRFADDTKQANMDQASQLQ